MGNTFFFSAKKLKERSYFLGLFELSMIFLGLGNMDFRAVSVMIQKELMIQNTKFLLKMTISNLIKLGPIQLCLSLA